MTHSTLHEMQYNDAVAGLIPLVPLVALKRGGGKRTMVLFPPRGSPFTLANGWSWT